MTPHIERSLAKARKHFGAGRLDKADALLRGVLAELPDCTEALEGLALVATKKGAYPRALQALERLAAIHPQLAEAHYGKGCVLGMMGRFEDELAAYRVGYRAAAEFRAGARQHGRGLARPAQV